MDESVFCMLYSDILISILIQWNLSISVTLGPKSVTRDLSHLKLKLCVLVYNNEVAVLQDDYYTEIPPYSILNILS